MWGPWRILEQCPARIHNSASACRGYDKNEGVKCICPHSLDILEKQRKGASIRQAERFEGRVVIPSWWTGPWQILEECPADGHNVLSRIVRPIGGNSRKCVCPRAESLYAVHLGKRKAQRDSAPKRERDRSKSSAGIPYSRILSLNPKKNHSYAAPDWRNAVCRQPWALPYVDAAFDGKGQLPKMQMVNICEGYCPLRKVCRAWVLAEESPAGSWGGVWGGLTPDDRVKIKTGKAK